MTIKYVKTETAKIYTAKDSNDVVLELLWGDRVELVSTTPENGRYKVNARWARNMETYIDEKALGDQPLLELYFIDVGQGDGVLIVTPERKHILIDGGYTREMQAHGKSAADFVDWKFFKEYGMNTIELDAMISSHCDADHYGGLWDLLNNKKANELDTSSITVKNFYHAGVSWWTNGEERSLGKSENGALKTLLSDNNSVNDGLNGTAGYKLQGQWSEFLKCVSESGAIINRLGCNPEKDFEYLPGFEKDKSVALKILAPIEKNIDGQPSLKDFGSDSQNTNGNSILLRLDYKKSRILLTGDLNLNSQQYILESLKEHLHELSADVIKACHHGSDDCSYSFLKHVNAAATIISSGDDENHSHPRPNVVAASGITGYPSLLKDKLITPLIYSTEISRSLKLGDPYQIEAKGYDTPSGKIDIQLKDEANTDVFYKYTASGGLKPQPKMKALKDLKVVHGIVYGLVNVRTDGNKILCATLNEGKSKWEIKSFDSRF